MIKLYLARHGETEGNVQVVSGVDRRPPSMNTAWNRPGAWVNFSAMSISMPSTAKTLQRAKVTAECRRAASSGCRRLR